MAYKMKGSPFQRNFGIGSPAKQKDRYNSEGEHTKKKSQEEIDAHYVKLYGVTEKQFDEGNEEENKRVTAEYNAKQASKKGKSIPQDTPRKK